MFYGDGTLEVQMQKTNWIIFFNSHIEYTDEGLDVDDDYPIRSNFTPIDLTAGVFLKTGDEIWVLFKPHKGKDCVRGYKRVKILKIEGGHDVRVIRYQTFDPRQRHEGDFVTIRRNEKTHSAYTLVDEGRLEYLAVGKAIYIDECR
jgi:hypothetical protein